MSRLDDPAPLNLDALLETIYAVQADLKMLVEQLSRDRQPDLHEGLVQTLSAMHFVMEQQQVSLRRH